ncbi:MAG TPA: zf-HC2 domain-containing protein [Vicinamibacterales bacterium]|nr:zf-HC2 domain-containing protein [Vicinamibacterales bacterium]
MTLHDDAMTDRLSEYIDGELSAGEQVEMERHLAACAACREVADDLRELAARAPQLPASAPAADLWPAIAERIAAEPRGRVVPFGRGAARRFMFTLPQLAAAGIALMVLTGSAVLYLTRSAAPARGERISVADQAAAGADVTPVSLADQSYDSAIADLEEALEQGRARLDPETVRVLEQNLAAIDEAIAQCRQALEADPANAFLNSHLVSARQRKLALLRRATALTMGS